MHLPPRRLWGISPVCGRSGRERRWNGTIHAKLKEGGIVICINCLGLNSRDETDTMIRCRVKPTRVLILNLLEANRERKPGGGGNLL